MENTIVTGIPVAKGTECLEAKERTGEVSSKHIKRAAPKSRYLFRTCFFKAKPPYCNGMSDGSLATRTELRLKYMA